MKIHHCASESYILTTGESARRHFGGFFTGGKNVGVNRQCSENTRNRTEGCVRELRRVSIRIGRNVSKSAHG